MSNAAFSALTLRDLGRIDYQKCWQAMQDYTQTRQPHSADQIWLAEHPAVFTQGLNGQAEHIKQTLGDIPLIHTDRGGQITYHAPGQLMFYTLIDLKRRQLSVRQMVSLLETACIRLLADYDLNAKARADAPGIYLQGQKMASLGLKVKRQGCYHGLALNVAMDMTPFQLIHPCGLQGVSMTQISDHYPNVKLDQVKIQLCHHFERELARQSYKAQRPDPEINQN